MVWESFNNEETVKTNKQKTQKTSAFLSSCRIPNSKPSTSTQTTCVGEFSKASSSSCRETSGREVGGRQGSIKGSLASAFVWGSDGNLPGWGFTIQIRVNSHVHSFQMEALIYTV